MPTHTNGAVGRIELFHVSTKNILGGRRRVGVFWCVLPSLPVCSCSTQRWRAALMPSCCRLHPDLNIGALLPCVSTNCLESCFLLFAWQSQPTTSNPSLPFRLPRIRPSKASPPKVDELLVGSELFEQISFQTAVNDGCTRVLVLLSRPDGGCFAISFWPSGRYDMLLILRVLSRGL